MREKFTGRGQDRDESRLPSAHLLRLAGKLISTGAEAVNITREEIRSLVELNPREAVSVMMENVIKGTDQLQSILVREAQRYLNAIDLRDEVGKVLSNYTIEVNASINFVPREKRSIRQKILHKDNENKDNAQVETEAFKVTFVPKPPEREKKAKKAGEGGQDPSDDSST